MKTFDGSQLRRWMMFRRYASERHFHFRYLLAFLIVAALVYSLLPGSSQVASQFQSSQELVTWKEKAAIPSSSELTAFVSSNLPIDASSTDGPNPVSEIVPIRASPALDRPQFHVVVAHYEEEPYFIGTWLDDLRQVPYMKELGLQITIYTKGPSSNAESIKAATAADRVVKLPNIGREGGTYLRHILENYNDPPLFMLFAQSYLKKAQKTDPGPTEGHMKEWLNMRLHEKFDNQTGFMSLDRKHDLCYCGHCTDMGRDDFYPLWSQFYTLITGTVCQRHEGHLLSFNGHFIVSRRRILAQPRRIYEYLQELVDAPEGHWIHAEPEPAWFSKHKGESVPSNPKFGHTLERLWHTLFACDRPEQVTDCDVSGMKAEGPGGCSCKDLPYREA